MDMLETFNYSENGIDFTVNVICYNEFGLFADLWEMTDDHKGGVTVKNPNDRRNCYKYGIPLQYSLKERIADLIAKGDDNPSANAYQAAQEALERDLDASDYGFRVTATANGITLLDDHPCGCSFDYSYLDDQQLIDAAKEVYKENGIDGEALEEAKKAGAEILANVSGLENILKSA
uniref:Uncharacterized protein n=1 Tax=Salmonella phage vB_SEnST11_KE22 TaxID=3161173 RepID=A0AAU8GGY0_9CAUD